MAAAVLAGVAVPVAAGAATAEAAAATPQVSCSSAAPGLAAKLQRDITSALEGGTARTAVSVHDRATGTSCTLRADQHFDSASTVKVTVLATLLRDVRQHHRHLTSREAGLATAMITKSDNDATTALWKQLGVAKVSDFLSAAGMTHTVPDGAGAWGLTQITAGDEQKLMDLLTAPNAVLGDNARAYALKLMNEVVPSQRWGTPRAPRTPRSSTSRTAGSPVPPTVGGCTAWAPSPAAGTTTASPSSPTTTRRWPPASPPSRASPARSTRTSTRPRCIDPPRAPSTAALD